MGGGDMKQTFIWHERFLSKYAGGGYVFPPFSEGWSDVQILPPGIGH
jgi:hypothetical protein